MEDLAPTYLFVLHLIEDLSTGVSARSSVKRYLREHRDDLTAPLLAWLAAVEQGRSEAFTRLKETMAPVRKHIFELLDFAGRGAGVLPTLQELEIELRRLSQQQLDEHLARLPFKMMLPLLLCQFPALLLLILGPLLLHLLKEVG